MVREKWGPSPELALESLTPNSRVARLQAFRFVLGFPPWALYTANNR